MIMPFLRFLCIVFTFLLLSACANKEARSSSSSDPLAKDVIANITVKNRSISPYKSAPLYIPYTDLELETEDFGGLNLLSGHESIPFETIDQDGDGDKDGFFALVDINPQQTLVLQLKRGNNTPRSNKKLTQAEISVKKGGKWVPHPNANDKKAYQGGTFNNVQSVTLPHHYTDHSEWIRYEGPGIESDKVAYRIYLDHRNGFDIFGKKLNKPVLQLIGQDGYASYHNMLDWGMDILKVGSSLGAGGFGFWDGTKLTMVSDTLSRSARIIENGNLYSSLAIDYGQWLVDGERRDTTAVISMHGGSRLAQNRITLDGSLPNLAIGVVKHQGTEFITGNFDGPYSYIASWGQQSESGDNLGMAVIFKSKNFQQTVEDNSSYVALMAPDQVDGKSILDYYFVAAWQGEHNNGIATKQQFITYLDSEVQKLSQPIQVTVNNQ